MTTPVLCSSAAGKNCIFWRFHGTIIPTEDSIEKSRGRQRAESESNRVR